MTPEERAAKCLYSDWTPKQRAELVKNSTVCRESCRRVAAAIRAAEEAERQACAKVAENTCPSSDLEAQELVQRHIAAAIRARSNQ